MVSLEGFPYYFDRLTPLRDMACITLALSTFSRKLLRPQCTSSLPITSPGLTECDSDSIVTGQRSNPFNINLNLGMSSFSIPTT